MRYGYPPIRLRFHVAVKAAGMEETVAFLYWRYENQYKNET
jgi:hypothetical protein